MVKAVLTWNRKISTYKAKTSHIMGIIKTAKTSSRPLVQGKIQVPGKSLDW